MTKEAVKTFGVKEFTSADSELEQALEDIRIIGYTIVPDVLNTSELEQAREKTDHVYAVQVKEVGGEDQLVAINDAHTARCPLAYDNFFLEVATKSKVLTIVEKLLGEYFILMLQNGVINSPSVGNEQNAGYWHRDLNYQHFISTRPISISALFCIDAFSEETGGTFVLPASHRAEAFPSESFVLQHEKVVNAPAGSALVFDSMLYHRGGLNRSPHPRRGLNHMYALPLIKQQISLPRLLKGKFSDDPFLSKFLGYTSEPQDSVYEFRKARLDRL